MYETHLVISSVLTARGVPGGTAAKTFDEAYLDAGCSIIWFYFLHQNQNKAYNIEKPKQFLVGRGNTKKKFVILVWLKQRFGLFFFLL